MTVWNFVSGDSLSKLSLLSNITKIPVPFKPGLYAQFGTYSVFKSNIYKLSFEPTIIYKIFEIKSSFHTK